LIARKQLRLDRGQPGAQNRGTRIARRDPMDRPRFFRLLLLIWLPVAGLLIGITWHLADDRIDNWLTLTSESQQRAIARGSESIVNAVDGIARDVRFLAAHAPLRAAVAQPTPDSLQELAGSLALFSEAQRVYDKLRWIDENGVERVRVDRIDGKGVVIPPDQLQDKARRYFVTEAMSARAGEVYVSPLDLNVDHDRIEVPHKPTLRVGTRVYDDTGAPRGIVLINYYGRDLLDAFARAASAAGRQAMLLNRDGYWLKAPDPDDEWGFMLGREETFATRHPNAWERIRTAETGQFSDADGIWTFATVRPLVAGAIGGQGGTSLRAPGDAQDDYFWKAVSLVPTAAVAAHRNDVWTQYAPALAFMLLLALLASARVAQDIERRRLADEALRRSHAELEQKVVERTERLAEREREHLQILEDSPSPIVVLRLADAALDYGNPAFLALLGIERGAVAGSSAEQLFVDPSHVRSILAALRQHGHAEGEVRLRAAGGRELDALMAARVTRFAGEPAVIASLVDITERKQWELALADSRQRYRQLFEAESDAILLIENATGRIIEANAAAARLYGYGVEELRSMTNDQLSAEPDATQRVTQSSPVDPGNVVVIPMRLQRRRDGTVIPVEITGRFFELGGQGVHIAAVRDISVRMETEHALRDANEQLSHRVEEIEELQATLREQAIRDALSGLFNRRFLEETCTRELARAQREGYPVALAMFDLDLFKRINDTYGHAAGDEVIVALARLLQQQARSSDTACRFGGEEFVLLLPGVDLETAAARVEELRRTFAESAITFGAFRLHASVSAGVAAYPAHGLTTRELIARADEALYAAKRAGRNRVEFWSDDALRSR
jgi:diguanylate cyclase (GGDEF)-like protein/PAS domain S-box-containing protein